MFYSALNGESLGLICSARGKQKLAAGNNWRQCSTPFVSPSSSTVAYHV